MCLTAFKGALQVARSAPLTSLYVQQLLRQETPAIKSAMHKELLDLKAQVADAAAALKQDRQAFQRAKVCIPAALIQQLSSPDIAGYSMHD